MLPIEICRIFCYNILDEYNKCTKDTNNVGLFVSFVSIKNFKIIEKESMLVFKTNI